MKIKHTLVGAFALTTAIACAKSKKVDTELLLLVEVPEEISKEKFDDLMASYGKAFRSEAVLNSINGGINGSIAASMMFFGSESQQVTAVDWFEINGEESAHNFAKKITSVSRAYANKETNIGKGLEKGLSTFSLNTENGFSSNAKIIDITGFKASTEVKEVKGAKVGAAELDKETSLKVRNAGVNSINGMSLGGEEVRAYYAANISNGEGSFTMSPDKLSLEDAIATKVSKGLDNANAVPEPSSIALAGIGVCSLLMRRRR